MNWNKEEDYQARLLDDIKEFVGRTKGLEFEKKNRSWHITQKKDGHEIIFRKSDLSSILNREDKECKEFIQINFCTNKKVILTDSLIGFKPHPVHGLEMKKLPKVVTTPDILSVKEAIQDSLASESLPIELIEKEIEILKKVFQSIYLGAKYVGFDLEKERAWFDRVICSSMEAAA